MDDEAAGLQKLPVGKRETAALPDRYRSQLNCTSLLDLCTDQQLVSYMHSYEIIPQDVLNFGKVALAVTMNTPQFGALPELSHLYGQVFFPVLKLFQGLARQLIGF